MPHKGYATHCATTDMPQTAQQTKQKDNIPKNPKTQFDHPETNPRRQFFLCPGFWNLVSGNLENLPGAKVTQVTRGSCGAKAPQLATRPMHKHFEPPGTGSLALA